jgi:hypothetical protein
MDIVIFAGCAITVAASWCMIALRITGRLHRARLPKKPARPTPPTPGDPPPEVDTQLTTEWASPTQVWPALAAENTLLAARIAGRITPGEYRTRMAELARHCEPHPTAGSE